MITLAELRVAEPCRFDNPHLIDHRRALCGTPCTINGQPAQVTGARLPFALILERDTGLGCEFAWPTVERVLAGSKNFRT